MSKKPGFREGDRVYYIEHKAVKPKISFYVSSGIIKEIKRSCCVILDKVIYDTFYYVIEDDEGDVVIVKAKNAFSTRKEVEELLERKGKCLK